jgi:hypothetical protein
MRKLLTITALVLFIALASPMWAQINDVYQGHPFIDSQPSLVQIWNTGQVGSPIDPATKQGTVCADIYVFDANQEMSECCNCKITANGVLTLSTDVTGYGLRANPLTGVAPQIGVYKIVSDAGSNCDATNPVPTPDLRAWAFGPTYDQFAQVPLQAQEQQFLGQACAFVIYLGSGKGQCSCKGLALTPP